MSQPYIGEIRMFGANFAPAGWAFCNGQLMPIAENDALFVLLGTTFGGDGEETFGIPNLQGRVPVHAGTLGGITYALGESAGTETVTLMVNQLPTHNHPLLCNSGAATNPNPQDNVMAEQLAVSAYQSQPPTPPLASESIVPVGGSQPHENMQPYLAISYIISLFGIFPSQT